MARHVITARPPCFPPLSRGLMRQAGRRSRRRCVGSRVRRFVRFAVQHSCSLTQVSAGKPMVTRHKAFTAAAGTVFELPQSLIDDLDACMDAHEAEEAEDGGGGRGGGRQREMTMVRMASEMLYTSACVSRDIGPCWAIA
eukprot:6175227-Prymnesium_polylepis.1